MNHRIIGTTLPVLELQLDAGDSVVAVSGELSWMSQSIDLETTTGISGGLGGLFKRVAGGGSIFMTRYTAQGAPGLLAFATKMPGHILPVEVARGSDYVVHRHGFLCGTDGVEVGLAFQQSLGAGIFGGDGFLLQKVSGSGQAWIELDGEVIPYTLAAGETLRVHPGHVGMFDASVRFEITRIRGIRNMLFGGDGIFLAALTGPGRIWCSRCRCRIWPTPSAPTWAAAPARTSPAPASAEPSVLSCAACWSARRRGGSWYQWPGQLVVRVAAGHRRPRVTTEL